MAKTESRIINSLKKERGQYPAILTEQAVCYMENEHYINLAAGTQRVNRERALWRHLAGSDS